MAKDDESSAGESISLDDGTEGSNVGFMTPATVVGADQEESSEASEEEEEEADNLLEEEEEGEEESEEEEEDEDLSGEEKLPAWLKKKSEDLDRDYTRKTKEIAGIRLKSQLVDQIEQNPEQTLKWLAQRFNVPLFEKPAEEAKGLDLKPIDLTGIQPQQGEDMLPFLNRLVNEGFGKYGAALPDLVTKAVTQALSKQKGPAVGAYEPLPEGGSGEEALNKKLEYLDKKYPDWGVYEKEMMGLLGADHSYYTDGESGLDRLYRVGKAAYIAAGEGSRIKAKKIAKKSKKLGKKKISSGARGPGKVITSPKGKLMTMDEAWERAKRNAGKKR